MKKIIVFLLLLIGLFCVFSHSTVEYNAQPSPKVAVEAQISPKKVIKRPLQHKKEHLPIPPETIAEIAKTVSDKTNVSQVTITGIIYYESGYKINAQHHNSNGTTDYGLFQINSCHWEEAKKMGLDLRNPYDNSKFAVYLIKIYGLTPWRSSQKNWE